jgi:3-methylcrotonyl-CoA carboxylase alpha subunit
MLAKVIAHGANRAEALRRLSSAIDAIRIAGPKTNLAFVAAVAGHPGFVAGGVTTDFVDRTLERLAGRQPDPALAATAIGTWAERRARSLASDAPGPWARADGFAIGGIGFRSETTAEIDGEPIVAELAWAAEGPRVAALGGKALNPGGSPQIVWGDGDAYVLHEGRQLHVVFPDPLARDPQSEAAGGEVKAPMHGRVVTVAVSEGGSVEKGDLLFTLEAMKMEHSILAPLAGMVANVAIAPGQQVEQGAGAVFIKAPSATPRPVEAPAD